MFEPTRAKEGGQKMELYRRSWGSDVYRSQPSASSKSRPEEVGCCCREAVFICTG